MERWWFACIAWTAMLLTASPAAGLQDTGSIRGVVTEDFSGGPLAGVRVTVIETGARVESSDQGIYTVRDLPPGEYTLSLFKEGYAQQVASRVRVEANALTDLDVQLVTLFTEMDEFIVEDILQLQAGSEQALLELRVDNPALLDSIGSELIGRAGASDAAGALKLVTGASIQDGKFAVIRGLPDRYVVSLLNGVRLPSADETTRAVELDQFPAVVIESLQVSKTFTPDQQGDASGGTVDIRLKSIPEEPFFEVKSQVSYNTQVTGESSFLSYDGGGLDFFGTDGGDRDPQLDNLGMDWDGAVGVSEIDAPIDWKWSAAAGGKHDLGDGVALGGLLSLFYERDSSYFDNGVDDAYWVEDPSDPVLTPEKKQLEGADEFFTSLFDVTEATQLVQWGGLGSVGLESDRHAFDLTYLYTHTAEDTATLAEDTRGKAFFFEDYDPEDIDHPGNQQQFLKKAPYLRTETLEYTERTASSLQLRGRHTLPLGGFDLGSAFSFREPELDWTVARSTADLDQPDKRQFGSVWTPEYLKPGLPFLGIPDEIVPPTFSAFKPAANFTLGNLQRIFKTIEENSEQYALNLKFPFEQWTETEGYLKFGVFDDAVERSFDQDTYSNFGEEGDGLAFQGEFDDFWSGVFPDETHPISDGPPFVDVDYDGELDITAWYGMAEIPLSPSFRVIGGARFERTDISIVNDPEPNAKWFPEGASTGVVLQPGDADVEFDQHDVLPSIGFVYEPFDGVTLRSSYSETVARQTFRELTPIIQQEFLGGPIFIGNPDLQMAALKNYDVRVDYEPYDGALLSASWFKKDLTDPIEFVQRIVQKFSFTEPVNYPTGELRGAEFEVRQDLGHFWDEADGLRVGFNATVIHSKVDLPQDVADDFAGLGFPITSRDLTNAPEHLYNCLLYTSPSPRDGLLSRMPSSA